MPKLLVLLPGALALSVLLLALPASGQDKKPGAAIQVQLNYTGSGAVDDKHKIYVVLWDSPDFVKGGGSMPVTILSSDSKTGMVTFADVKTTPAYVSTAFDRTGVWDGASGPPITGSSLGLYSKTPGQPEPVSAAPGEAVKITVAFDDSTKMH